MKDWKYTKLYELCEIFPGYAFDSSKFTSNEEDLHLVKGENLHQGYIDWKNSKRWNNNSIYNLEKFLLREKDIVVAMDRPWIEAGLKWSSIKKNDPKALLVQRVARLRSKKSLDQNFLKYIIGSRLFEGYIKPIVTGVNVPHISGKQIGEFKFPLPPLPIQKKIAAILSAYDDLIEKNNRRISILEKMAEELYKEWFVRLRFPGYEKTKIKNGIPEGWEVKTVEEAFEYTGGGTPSTNISAYWEEGNINWYSPTDITANNSYFIFESKGKITELGLKESSAKLFPAYSIMLTSRATIGELGINVNPSCTNQGFITCIPNEKLPIYYLFYWLKLNKELFIQLANGATFLEITKGKFKKINIIIPSSYIMNKYSIVQKPVFSQIQNLQSTISNLTSTRDRLLSRLLSGKIDVENLDIKFPDSMKEDA